MRFVLLILSLGLLQGARPVRAAITVDSSGARIRIASPAAAIVLRKARCRWQLTSAAEGTLAREGRRGGFFYERAGRRYGLRRIREVTPLPDGARLAVDTDEGTTAILAVSWLTDRTVRLELTPPTPDNDALGEVLRSPTREAIYGLTSRLRDSPPVLDGVIDIPVEDITPVEVGSLDRRGEVVAIYVRPTEALAAPFFHSSNGYGLAAEGTTIGEVDVAATDRHQIALRFETGRLPDHRRLALQLFVGPEHATILDEYTRANGRPFVPPPWAFRHWRWRDLLPAGMTGTLDGFSVQGTIAADLAQYDALGLPPGVWVFDRPVFDGEYGFARFNWDIGRLPNQGDLLDRLRARGWRTMLWSAAWTCGNGPLDLGTEAASFGFHVPGPPGPPRCADIGGSRFILDVTNPAARNWFAGKVRDAVHRGDIDGIKLDRGEEHLPSAATDIWADGRTGREARNAYPTLQAQLHHDALLAAHPDRDFIAVVRAGYTGTAQYAVAWGGDIPGNLILQGGASTDLGLRTAIIAQQRAAFLGYPIWGSDIGGYDEFRDREVFARWLQFGTFSGIMEIGGKGNHAPWDMPTPPTVDAELIDIYVRYVRLRETLRPYIVAASAAATSGLPIVRPMPFEDRRDPALRDRWDQYLFGPDLLVAPVWRVGQRQREVYFPRGRWRNYWTPSDTIEGPGVREVVAPLDTIPVFVRDGAVVPGPLDGLGSGVARRGAQPCASSTIEPLPSG